MELIRIVFLIVCASAVKSIKKQNLMGDSANWPIVYSENSDENAEVKLLHWFHQSTEQRNPRLKKFFVKSTRVITGEISESDPETTVDENQKLKLGVLNFQNLNEIEGLFQKFQARFDRNYETEAEHQLRFSIFKQNLKNIVQLNKNERGTAVYGITDFADLSESEIEMRGRLSMTKWDMFNLTEIPTTDIPNIELPENFDWRDKPVVTKVKNQAKCGSCWAFSVVGNIESLNAIKNKNLVNLSEQQLLDCDTADNACDGGNPIRAYRAIKSMGGLERESDYPYHAKKEACKLKKDLTRVQIKDFNILPRNEDKMQQWLFANGPISIAINVHPWAFYQGGVVHADSLHCSPDNINHAMLVVGFGVTTDSKLPFWIIKNSWGSLWGEEGYARVYRGDNTCGLTALPTSAVL